MAEHKHSRLDKPWGSLIDRRAAISFEFDGESYYGYAGDTLASALAANGRFLLSRSTKYHRPRGALAFAGHDANTYVQLGDQPNAQADRVAIHDGMVAYGQNYAGSLWSDRGAIIGYFSRFLPAGFYYRAFFRPRGIWSLWERLFRRAAGLGEIDPDTEWRHFDKQHLHTDIAIIGGGPAGLSAAVTAAKAGASVLLIEESSALGGSMNYARFQRQRGQVEAIRNKLVFEVAGNSQITVLTGATCSGWYADNWLAVDAGSRLYKVRAREVIACTGSVEQPMIFQNNDLPGILPASGVQRLLRLYGVRPGKRAVVVTSNVEGYDAAVDLKEAGVSVEAIVDLNSTHASDVLAKQLQAKGVKFHTGCTVTSATAGKGNRSISGVVINHLSDAGVAGELAATRDCDLLVTSVGYAPLGQLPCHAGARMVYDEVVNSFVVQDCPPHAYLAGSVNHKYTLESAFADGLRAAQQAAQALGHKAYAESFDEPDDAAVGASHPCPIFPHATGKEFVDFDADQTIADLRNAIADGFEHAEQVKRYSNVGMGPSQGRLSALNATRIVQAYNGTGLTGAAATTQRPPYRPLGFGVLAGRGFKPVRQTPMHDWHAAQGAQFTRGESWQRPVWYGDTESRQGFIDAEVAAVRQGVGVVDVATLGGIELRGPDAGEFLNRMATFEYANQPVGTTRYLLMTNDAGCIVDNGVACRLDDEHFYVTTTPSGADAVFRRMLRRNAEWGLRVSPSNVSSAWVGISVAGPQARQVVERLASDIDFSASAFPYLGVRTGTVCGASAMILRGGYVGELDYELHVPASNALQVWESVMRAGQHLYIRPVGVAARRVLRLEKGRLIVGQDTDALTTPRDAAVDWAVSMHKPEFVGKAAIRFANLRPGPRKLAGFRLLDAAGPMPREYNLVLRGDEISGRVTSIARSAQLDEVIGLAYVSSVQAPPGTLFDIKVDGKRVQAEAIPTPFYDPQGLRQAL